MSWRLWIAVAGVSLAAFLAAGQAVTFAWLSAFPERASQLESLETRFWGYATVSAILVIVDLILLVRLVRRGRNRPKPKSERGAD